MGVTWTQSFWIFENITWQLHGAPLLAVCSLLSALQHLRRKSIELACNWIATFPQINRSPSGARGLDLQGEGVALSHRSQSLLSLIHQQIRWASHDKH
ncbi:hypothetical protein DPEC_G00145360 [Dallia pectoralis]|uniref:Uncharacterized protein n=1 Tax=Dallia pectoralis TaxID=75939 RepID=A0ACC2GP95_DALPE|nr:hypothetical protein DPEC_G00145360 [Dallia pectoralis]